MIRPANQYEIEAALRDGWSLTWDRRRAKKAWLLWPPNSTDWRLAHGKSCIALLRRSKIVQYAADVAVTRYCWADPM